MSSANFRITDAEERLWNHKCLLHECAISPSSNLIANWIVAMRNFDN
jgi:hypothetical protein